MKNGDALWTLDELTAEVTKALAEGYEGPASGRVRAVPDRRTIRYYTTVGLIDRPSEMRGRTALYGRRHLLQIVAIKKLQAAGRSLAEIQREMTGQTDAHLGRIAGFDAGGEPPARDNAPASKRAREFWRREPADHVAAAPREHAGRGDMAHLVGVPLDAGLTLLLAPSRPLGVEDIDAIRRSAAPMIETLIRFRLIEPRDQGDLP